ncbi:MAG: hypothetical protein GY941_11740 [Planctomycetes bacterium]|nr:hypothetical protein [Planctomycetota bacterium]
MTRYSGRFVALLIPDVWPGNNGFIEEEIRQLLDHADVMYQHIYELIGQEPGGSGLLPIAFVPESCGWGCGYIGRKGVEILDAVWSVNSIRKALQQGIPHGVFYHEMLHNFDVFYSYLVHGAMDAHAWTVFLQYYANYYGRWGNLECSPDNLIKGWLDQVWEPYAKDPTATWEKCVRDGACPQFDSAVESAINSWGGFNNVMGLLLGPDSIKKAFAFLGEYAENHPPPSTDEGKADLNIEALAAGAEVNLSCYVDTWRWYASPELRSNMADLYGHDAPFCEPPGGEFVDPLHVTLPARITGRVLDTDHPDFFTFDLEAPGPVSIKICSRFDFQGYLYLYVNGPRYFQYVGQGGCSEVVHDLDEPRRWRIGLLDSGGYELTLTPVEAWPQPFWGQVLDTFCDKQKLHLEAVFENTDIISGQPDQIRFWTSGYGFIGTSPLNSEMVLEWVPDPPLQFGTYGFRAQLMQGDTPATDVTPGTIFVLEPQIVNNHVTFKPIRSTYKTTHDTTGCPEGFVGKFSFDARLTNISSSSLSNIMIKIAELTNGNLLITDDVKIDVSDAELTSTESDIGNVSNCFDGDPTTIMRSANINPAFVQVAFPTQQGITQLRVLLGQPGFPHDKNSWWVEAADTHENLDNKTGSYQVVVPERFDVAGTWDEVIPLTPVSRRIWRFWITRTAGDNFVHIPELELWSKDVIGEGESFYISKLGSYVDGKLGPRESIDVHFVVCLKEWKPFQFFVDVLGVTCP